MTFRLSVSRFPGDPAPRIVEGDTQAEAFRQSLLEKRIEEKLPTRTYRVAFTFHGREDHYDVVNIVARDEIEAERLFMRTRDDRYEVDTVFLP